MNIEKIHRAFINSRALFFTVLLLFVLVRLSVAVDEIGNPAFWGSMVIQIGMALLLLQLNQVFTIIRIQTFLPATFYLLFISSSSLFYFDLSGSLATLCFLLGFWCLFYAYQKPDAQLNAFNIALLLTLGSLLWTPLLFLFPIYWYGFHRLRSFNFKVFFASLTGIIVVYLFIFVWSVYAEDWAIFLSRLPQPDKWFAIQQPDFNLREWITIGFMLLVYIFAGFNLFISGISDKIQTVSILNYMYFSSFILFGLLFLQSEYKSQWALIIYIPAAILISHFFTLSNKRPLQYLMLVYLSFLLVICAWEYIVAFIDI
jgi:hypothetical protein